MVREALLYEKEAEGRVSCGLCVHRCRIAPGDRGSCGVRENRAGTLYSLVYGAIIAENVDPIEKKPLFHILPGSRSFSVAAAGCNFRCSFCQNHEISQTPRETGRIVGRERTPAEIVEMAVRSGSKSIAYTYTEPTVYFEFAFDIAGIAREKGLKNVFVTNGYMTQGMLELVAPRLDAANVDLKAFRDDFYKKQCGARLQPVLDSLRKMKELGIWVEVTTLLIPGLNDGEEELGELAAFIASLGAETPWHISRFHPPVPDDPNAADTGFLDSPGRRDRQIRRAEIRLQRKHPRRSGGEHPLRPLRPAPHRPLWLLHRTAGSEGIGLPPLRNAPRRDLLTGC